MNFKRLSSEGEVRSILEFHNSNSEFVVLDVETTSPDPRKCVLIDIQLSGADKDSAVIFSAEYGKLLQDLDKRLTLVGHNYKFDVHVLFRHGIDLLSHRWRDTLLMAHLLDENRESYSLDSFVKEYWNDPYKEEFWAEYQSYQEAPQEEADEYACKDIYYTGALYARLISMLGTDGIPANLVRDIHDLQASLLRTEIEGIRVDLKYLEELGVRLKLRIDELRPQMRSMVKDEIELIELEAWQREISKYKSDKGRAGARRPVFNFESSKQLLDLLYHKLCLPPQRNEKTRAISTDYASLEKIKEGHPIVGLIQENRELQKIYTSYVEGTLDRIDNERIYPQFRVAGTVTGRIAHSNPNLAQLPKSGGVRGIYVPDPGRVLISADYSQLEVLLEANLTGDKNLIRMFENGESKHDLTARELGCDRHTAKTLNFCLQYWGSHFKVAKLLGVSVDEGLRIWNKYWTIYSGPKQLKARTDKLVDDGLPIVTAFGRKRRFEKRGRSPWDKDYRMAYNFLIQGTGADITSRAFYQTDGFLRRWEFGRGLFTVHDELLIEAKEGDSATAETAMLSYMTKVGDDIGLKIPLKAESSGPMLRWED